MFTIFEGLSAAKNCLRPESAPLKRKTPEYENLRWKTNGANVFLDIESLCEDTVFMTRLFMAH